MADVIQRYGWNWDAATPDLEIELQAIRWGGEWRVKGGQWCGKGLFFHYRRAFELLWPEDDNHRWSDLMLKTILWETITVVQGGKDSSKTRTASKYALVDYWAFPEETLILMTSTDLRGADYRVWGDVKSLFIRGRDRYDWLPGKALEAKHSICTDDLEETDVRDPRKGLTFLPMFGSGGQWMGMSKACGIKQKRRRLLGDECFPAGTMVDTEQGRRAIESIAVGDRVWSATGLNTVLATGHRTASCLITVNTIDGRSITCTPEHPFLTQKGWIKALHLNQSHYILSAYESMRAMQPEISSLRQTENMLSLRGYTKQVQGMPTVIPSRKAISAARVLQPKLCIEMAQPPTGMEGGVLWTRGHAQKERSKEALARRQPGSFGRGCAQDARLNSRTGFSPQDSAKRHIEGYEMEAYDSRGKRHWANKGRAEIDRMVPGWGLELSDKNRKVEWQRLSVNLFSGLGLSTPEAGNRSGRKQPQLIFSERERRKKDAVPRGAWVDSVTVQKCPNPRMPGNHKRKHTVYNLEVAGHPSYSVEGLIVHNCQFNKQDYIDTLANINSGNFKGVFLGNPIGENDPLDRLAEPVGGWGTEGEVKKTTTWRNKFGGVTITLYGPDSPNFDQPQTNGFKKFPYIIGQKDIDWIANTYGKDSSKYWMQAIGVRRAGIDAKRVITMQLCELHGALEPAIWSGGSTVWVAALDAAYGGIGGDRCVLQFGEFGPTLMVGNQPPPGVFDFGLSMPITKTILKCYPPILVPVSVSNSGEPEDQIALFCKQQCETRGVQPSHFFFDGRGTLAMSLARIWSPDCNAVEFGGAPTKRPVSQDHWVYDAELHSRRLKRCDEEYSKFVTELWFSVRYAIMSGQIRELPRETMLEGCKREWRTVTRDRMEVETKAEMKERTNQSPDLFDSTATMLEGARRLGFQISKMGNAAAAADNNKWIEDLAAKSRKLHRSKELVAT